MAKAEMRTVIVPKPVELKRITLEMTVAEARTLATLFEKIGGDPVTTLRGKIDNMYYALSSAGVEPYDVCGDDSEVPLNVTGNSLYFDDNSISYIQPGEDE